MPEDYVAIPIIYLPLSVSLPGFILNLHVHDFLAGFQVGLEVGGPGAGPVGEDASGVVIVLVAAVLGAVGQGGGIDPALGIAFGQTLQSSLHGGLGEAVNPLAFRILVEGGVAVLIELRQVVDEGSFGADEAGSTGKKEIF